MEERFKEIDELLRQCRELDERIVEIRICNACNEDSADDISEGQILFSPEWKKFVDCVDTYFKLYPDDEATKDNKSVIQALCSYMPSDIIRKNGMDQVNVALEKLRNAVKIEQTEKRRKVADKFNGTRSILRRFPTEILKLHKKNGEIYEVEGVLGENRIMTEAVNVPIEPRDYYERVLPNGLTEYYEIIDPGYHKGMGNFSDQYNSTIKRIEMKEGQNAKRDEKAQKMIFLSHATMDKEYTKAFVDLLFGIGLNEENIVCSSYPGVGIPLREKVYDWLVGKFRNCDLHVIFFLSKNYYDSAASLNEMGAAWAMKKKSDAILLPGFSFSDIKGCIDSTQIAIKLDGDIDELKHRLGELKDNIIEEFGLRDLKETRWENIRKEFIEKFKKIEGEGTNKEIYLKSSNGTGDFIQKNLDYFKMEYSRKNENSWMCSHYFEWEYRKEQYGIIEIRVNKSNGRVSTESYIDTLVYSDYKFEKPLYLKDDPSLEIVIEKALKSIGIEYKGTCIEF